MGEPDGRLGNCQAKFSIMQIVRAKPDEAASLIDIAFAAKRQRGYPETWIESWRDALTVWQEFIASYETYAAIHVRTIGLCGLGHKNDKLDLHHMWVLLDDISPVA